jgi:S1-C subfamily serine protease
MKSHHLVSLALVCALIGGGIVALAVGVLHVGQRTVTEVAASPAAPLVSSESVSEGHVLTARDIYKEASGGVVFITATIEQQVQPSDPFFDFGTPQVQQGTATGSGFMVDRDGTILTNAHVINGATKVLVRGSNLKTVTAKIVGRDVSDDLAVLKINPAGLGLHPLKLGSSGDVQVGDPTIAIGNPFGLDRTLTTGVVSALQRQIQAPNGFKIDHVIQTDAAINPGNSGGPLIDSAGEVIGVNSQIETGGASTAGNIGIGFAIPIDTAKQVIPQIEKQGTVQAPFLGVTTETIDQTLAPLNLAAKHGALVQTVDRGSAAAKAGIKPGNVTATIGGTQVQIGGDIITQVAGEAVTGADQLRGVIASHKVGDAVSVTIIRAGKTMKLEVTLGAVPAQTGATTAGETPIP